MSTGKNRLFMAVVLTVGLLAHDSADARPEPIPKPVASPDVGESPGTGQQAPDDPEEPELIPPPEGLQCSAADEDVCDPDHPGNAAGKQPNNEPPPSWYDDMAEQMYNLQESLDDMSKWGADHDPYIEYYALWMRSVVQQYYALGYDYSGKPHDYDYGPMTRGDYNYYYYYWVRPIYLTMLHYCGYYYESHWQSPDLYRYQTMLGEVVDSYHALVKCNYGFNGDDEGAREDLYAQMAERNAGLLD